MKRPFNAKGYKAKDLLELVHSDVCGSMSIQARGDYRSEERRVGKECQ